MNDRNKTIATASRRKGVLIAWAIIFCEALLICLTASGQASVMILVNIGISVLAAGYAARFDRRSKPTYSSVIFFLSVALGFCVLIRYWPEIPGQGSAIHWLITIVIVIITGRFLREECSPEKILKEMMEMDRRVSSDPTLLRKRIRRLEAMQVDEGRQKNER